MGIKKQNTSKSENKSLFPNVEGKSEEVNFKKDFCEKYFDKGTWSLDVLKQVDVLLKDRKGHFLLYIESKYRITNDAQRNKAIAQVILTNKKQDAILSRVAIIYLNEHNDDILELIDCSDDSVMYNNDINWAAEKPSNPTKDAVNSINDRVKGKTICFKNEEIKVEEPQVEKEMTFDEMLEESLKPIYNGDKVSGTVVAITGTEISVDLGTKQTGIIPTEEFTEDGTKLEDAVKVGDTLEAVVVRVNDVDGVVTLSKKRLDAAKIWNEVEAAVEDGTVMEGVVTEENKGGVVVSVKGVRVFVPASQTDLPRDAEMSQLLKKTVRLKITEVNKARKRVVGSIRRVAQAERRERTEAIWNNIEIGKRYNGVVKSLTSYGAFVDIGGIDGMVHVSELSWGRIHQPSEVVSVGDEIEVYVINFDREKRKISLGYKDPNGNPWTQFTSKYQVGDIAPVTIVKLMDFGAFAEVLPGVDGLIHISQIANRRIGKPGDVLTVGDVVDAKITAIDDEKHKISLSIRALSEPAPVAKAPVEEEEAPEEAREDALVYEVSADGTASGIAPEAEVEE